MVIEKLGFALEKKYTNCITILCIFGGLDWIFLQFFCDYIHIQFVWIFNDEIYLEVLILPIQCANKWVLEGIIEGHKYQKAVADLGHI